MEVKPEPTASVNPRSRTLGTIALIGVLVTPGVLTWLITRERPSLPTEMPALVLDADAVAEQTRADAGQAAELPTSDAIEAHRAAFRAMNLAEVGAGDAPAQAQLRRERLLRTVEASVQAHGPEIVSALRIEDMERALAALRGGGPERDADLGSFVATLEQYGLVRAGRQVAPTFVVRTLYKARWNSQHRRELTEDLSPVELRAYWGWLLLRSEAAPLARRLGAVTPYREAGGQHGEEARGVLLMQAGRRDEAAEAFEAAWEEMPRFRVRNHALAARAGS
ncbi:MAG: hypothetical protein AB8I08_04820 [Sandaracinaceae bacterium]